jgi:hypothetical protein
LVLVELLVPRALLVLLVVTVVLEERQLSALG